MTRPWTSPELTGVGRLPMHAVPHPERFELDGRWRFQLLRHPDATPDPQGWREIDVPGCWTRQDTWDLPQYTNVQMPFAGLPPELPEVNPTGIYAAGLLDDGRTGTLDLAVDVRLPAGRAASGWMVEAEIDGVITPERGEVPTAAGPGHPQAPDSLGLMRRRAVGGPAAVADRAADWAELIVVDPPGPEERLDRVG